MAKRDPETWAQAKQRARFLAEEAGETDGRRIVRAARAAYLESTLMDSKLPISGLLREPTPERLPLTRERLAAWQERNRAQATDAEIDAAMATLIEVSERCATCEGARFVREPGYKPGQNAHPLHGNPTQFARGIMPCPSCAAQKSAQFLREKSNVRSTLRALSLDDFDALEGKQSGLTAALEWVSGVHRYVVLYGQPGRGKTHLAIGAVNACCDEGVRAEYWPWQDALAEMQRRFDVEHDSAQDFAARLAAVPALAIDDLGAEQRSRSGWSTEVFEHLLDARIQAHLPTLITTNLAPSALGAHVEARAASRLQLFRFSAVEGLDMRAVMAQRGVA